MLWLDQAIEEMGSAARARADTALDLGQLLISTITFWEIGMLIGKRRISLGRSLGDWRADLINSGVIEVPTGGRIAIAAAELEQLHGDPADRLILATALELEATLVTADRRLLAWPGELERIDARR
jgi:PIN domain nuclease of toxin-antitoxin system